MNKLSLRTLRTLGFSFSSSALPRCGSRSFAISVLSQPTRNSSTSHRQSQQRSDNNITLDDLLEAKSRGESRMKGRVQFFDRKRGFGFIIPNEEVGNRTLDQEAFFVHRKALLPLGFISDREYVERNLNNARTYLEDGELVEFELRDYHDQVHAANVTGPNGGRLRVWVPVINYNN